MWREDASFGKVRAERLLVGNGENSQEQPSSIALAAAAAAANVCEVTITVQRAKGQGGVATLAGVYNLDVWLSDAATVIRGDAFAHLNTVKTASGAVLGTLTAKKALRVQTLATGVFILEITDTAKTAFKVCAKLDNKHEVFIKTLATGDYGS